MPIEPGWAIRRNGSCLLMEEVDCGETASPFRACCPSSTFCPAQYNTACCPANVNCTAAIVEIPSCANSSWIMFDNGGYFCCEKGQVGYNIDNTDGCSLSGKALPPNAVPLAVVDQIFSSVSTSTSIGPTSHVSTPSPPSSSSPSSSRAPSTNTGNHVPGGTIAGAVVGGVAGIATIAGLLWWSFIRKKTNSSASASKPSQHLHRGIDEGNGNQNRGYSTMPIARSAELGGTPKSELLATDGMQMESRSEMP
ncbi:hypothetical protein F5Y10DRAFT_262259 [Nemania abortiva]|nr:hypothetical protein F5Y10DRAFT_262259 [Nemania abortiva]